VNKKNFDNTKMNGMYVKKNDDKGLDFIITGSFFTSLQEVLSLSSWTLLPVIR